MYDAGNHQPHTQHTTNLVPLIYIGRDGQLNPNGALSDLAPTILSLMGLSQPAEMTGKNLVQFNA
jgi:2,3-bisphosphoglycerate-independent phosphoglycerate mutase